MGAEIQIASFFASLGLKVDEAAWAKADQHFEKMQQSLSGLGTLAAKVAAGFGFAEAVKKSVALNMSMEDSKNQIAAMLALSKHTNVSDELSNASKLYSDLEKKAATLPGNTQNYVETLQTIVQPLSAAGAGMQDLEDMTVQTGVAAHNIGVPFQEGALQISEAVNGMVRNTDRLTIALLKSVNVSDEAFRAMSSAQRVAVLKTALAQKQITQAAEIQGQSFSARLETLEDAGSHFLRGIGKGLFDALGPLMEQAATWLAQNQDEVAAVAATIGNVLVSAFEAVGAAVGWIVDHGDAVLGALAGVGVVMVAIGADMAAAWLATAAAELVALAPVLAIVAAAAAVGLGVVELVKHWDAVKDAIGRAWKYIAIAFAPLTAIIAMIVAIVKGVIALVEHWDAVKAAIGRAWNAVKNFGRDVKDFFVGIWDGIGDAFKAVFDWMKTLPVIKQILEAIDWVRSHVGGGGGSNGDGTSTVHAGLDPDSTQTLHTSLFGDSNPAAVYVAPPVYDGTPVYAGGNTSSRTTTNNTTINIDAGGVSDPHAVGKIVDERLRDHFRAEDEP